MPHYTPQENTLSTNQEVHTAQDPTRNDVSFLDQVLAGIKPTPPNLNTYTQLTL